MPTPHSPAPFSLGDSWSDYTGQSILDANGNVIAVTSIEDATAATEEERANARLFVQAPVMLGALEDAANVLALALALGHLKGQQAEAAYRNAIAIIDAAKGA